MEYIAIYCTPGLYAAIQQCIPIYSNLSQYSAVFSSIQQYSAVFSSIRSAGFWRSGAAVLPQTGAQGHDGARGRLRAPDRWLIVRRLDGGRPYAQTDRERLRPECKMGSRRRLRWRMSSRIDALSSASGCHASTANVGIAEPTHLGWPPRVVHEAEQRPRNCCNRAGAACHYVVCRRPVSIPCSCDTRAPRGGPRMSPVYPERLPFGINVSTFWLRVHSEDLATHRVARPIEWVALRGICSDFEVATF